MSAVEVAPREVRPPVRLRPVPRCDPPFDDETGARRALAVNQLALDLPTPARLLRPPPTPAAVERARQMAAAQAATRTSGDAKLAVRRFVQMCVEVLNGYRPAAHLRRVSLPKDAAGVVAQAVAGSSRVAGLRDTAAAGRKPSRHGRRPGGPVAVLRFHFCEPRPGAVEAAVLLVTGERTWAMALRMELHNQSWAATTMRLI